jgi:hypothetical protein
LMLCKVASLWLIIGLDSILGKDCLKLMRVTCLDIERL